MITIGDFVTRDSYGNDIIFEVIAINKNYCILKGVNVRLSADAPIKDLVLVNRNKVLDDFCPNEIFRNDMDRNEFFYIPGKILHLDGDKSYLDRCLNYYKQNNIKAIGKCINESDMPKEIVKLLKEYNPDILVLTGHDAYQRNNGSVYKNSENFSKAVLNARKYEKSSDKLIIIAGACQSNYELLIKSGATFASSPKRINIHALDPAIIASSLCLSDRNKEVDLVNLLNKTKYGKDGIGGLKSMGTMYVGYPRTKKETNESK